MSSLGDRVRNWSWWKSPEWAKYCAAYGSEPERPIKGLSYVVDLTEPVKPTKGHNAAANRQMKSQALESVSEVERFHQAHALAAGRETRPAETWEVMQGWLDNGQALCATNGVGGWVFVIMDQPGAFYASAAGPDTHFLQMTMIDHLQVSGFDWYEMGEGHTPGIDTFKAGFGGMLVEP